jgi:acylphosphatase
LEFFGAILNLLALDGVGQLAPDCPQAEGESAVTGRAAKETPHERRDVLYSGRVQGVGFRYTTCEIAERFQVSGYVQNLPDGCVRLVTEGEADELQRFLDAVSAELERYIANAQIRSAQATGEFADFQIKR